MLAYAAACQDLMPVEGRENMVLKAVRLTKEGACIIDACMAHRFVGEWRHGACDGLSKPDTSKKYA